jgi:gentisate 1,2-dioxygenase
MLTTPTDEEIQAGWRDAHVRPLWEIAQAHAPDPAAGAPVAWPWATLEPLVERAIALASPASAERRVLSLIDPSGRPGDFQTTTNLNAGLQILLPGEAARPHRHSPDALRFVLEGGGAVTKVDGTLAKMEFGDLVLTPGWCWHEHWHEGDAPMVWLDVLNVHAHIHNGTFSFEPGPAHDVPPPVDVAAFRYPLEEAKRAADATAPGRDGARWFRYVDPASGEPVMPFLDSYLVRLDANQTTLPYRSSAHFICAVAEGRGSTTAGSGTIAWGPRDIFTLPNRATITHHADEPTYLFVTTDREILRRVGMLTEDAG